MNVKSKIVRMFLMLGACLAASLFAAHKDGEFVLGSNKTAYVTGRANGFLAPEIGMVVTLPPAGGRPVTTNKPNILLIVTDDQGFG